MGLHSLKDKLAELTAIHAPSGFEEPLLIHLKKEFQKITGEVRTDLRGNLWAIQEGTSKKGPKVMVCAHADEIGFMVTSVTADGFLRFTRIGGPTNRCLPGQRVHILTPKGPVEGGIGLRPGHLPPLEGEAGDPVPEKMFIDVGASSAGEARRWGIETGTPAVFGGTLAATRNPARVIGKAIDDRAGIAAMLEAAAKLSRKKISPTVVWCVSVEEEVGLRGAPVATQSVSPDIFIALDTVPTGGTPDLSKEELPWEIGKGPLLKVRETRGLITHGPLRRLFRKVAGKKKIPCQLIVDTAGTTDAATSQQVSGSIAALVLGIPRRYSHSAAELLDLNDLAATADLLIHTLPELKSVDQLKRY